MYTSVEIKKRLEKVFDEKQAMVLAEVIGEAYNGLVKTSDFNELKGIVKELAEAQKRTETRVEELKIGKIGTAPIFSCFVVCHGVAPASAVQISSPVSV